MSIDSCFIKGKSHVICQDYALHEVINDIPIIITTDGCSVMTANGKSIPHPHSDVAARLVALAARSTMLSFINDSNTTGIARSCFTEVLKSKLTASLKLFDLDFHAADATLNIAIEFNGVIFSLMLGDGILIKEMIDDSIEVVYKKYTPNAPYYISYCLEPIYGAAYHYHKVEARIVRMKIIGDAVHIEENIIDNEIDSIYNLQIIDKEDIKSVSVLSDGLLAIRERSELDLPLTIKELIDFKYRGNDFVKRRIKAFDRYLTNAGLTADDDISMATMTFS